MTQEEELATKVTFYALAVAVLLAFVADRACADGWGCAVANVMSLIPGYLAILVPLLLPLAIMLFFFLRGAGSSSKAADAEDVEERPSGDDEFSLCLQFLLLLATLTGTICFALYKYGYPELFDLVGRVALFFIFVGEALVYVRAALSLWRTNPKPSNMVAAE
ncbi:hypothetical protein ZWY2020_006934 [Hordeum vulgare]|nr:hypothetical protein ZWY2020_006934 [Hordeum vulgare]